MNRVAATWVVFVGCALLNAAEEHELSLDLDPLLSVPSVWSLASDDLEGKFPSEKFQKNPYIRWPEAGRDRATFPRKPYRNISVDARILGGTVAVEECAVVFRDGKAKRVVFIMSDRGSEAVPEEAVLKRAEAACITFLEKCFGSRCREREKLFGHNDEKKARSRVWETSDGSACLDTGPGILRFQIAAPGTRQEELLWEQMRPRSGGGAFFLRFDDVFPFANLWDIKEDEIDRVFATPGFSKSPYYRWLTSGHDAVRFSRRPFGNVTLDLTLCGGELPVDEIVIGFEKGVASEVTISVFNRGDSGEISRGEFMARIEFVKKKFRDVFGVMPLDSRPSSKTTAVSLVRWQWSGRQHFALLEYDGDGVGKSGSPDFLRLRIAPPSERDRLLYKPGFGGVLPSRKAADLLKYVKNDGNGDTYVSEVPMVDQGDKGYCVVASCQRLFDYLKVPCDQHELASLAGSSAEDGTSSRRMAEALGRISWRLRVRFETILEVDEDKREVVNAESIRSFEGMIKGYIDRGIPLLWSLELGKYPEIPPNKIQGTGRHMRLIIGYNSKTSELVFSDSWGAGHEIKRMAMRDAFDATTGIHCIEPRD